MRRGFLLGIGSNLDPGANVPRILGGLAEAFGELYISSVRPTAPEGMRTANSFLNLAAFVPTERPEAEVKSLFNAIEEGLGRDRSDPDKKIKDRPADIDILRRLAPGARLTAADLPTEPYLRPSVQELAEGLGLLDPGATAAVIEGRRLRLGDALFGVGAARIRWRHGGGVDVTGLP